MANDKTLCRIRTTPKNPALSRDAQDERNAKRKRRVAGYVGNPYADLVPAAVRVRQSLLYGVPNNG